jgi:hypothetical protein
MSSVPCRAAGTEGLSTEKFSEPPDWGSSTDRTRATGDCAARVSSVCVGSAGGVTSAFRVADSVAMASLPSSAGKDILEALAVALSISGEDCAQSRAESGNRRGTGDGTGGAITATTAAVSAGVAVELPPSACSRFSSFSTRTPLAPRSVRTVLEEFSLLLSESVACGAIDRVGFVSCKSTSGILSRIWARRFDVLIADDKTDRGEASGLGR